MFFSSLKQLALGARQRSVLHADFTRSLSSRTPQCAPRILSNILDTVANSAVSVRKLTQAGIELEDGLIIPGACIFLEGRLFLWDVPNAPLWIGWSKDQFLPFQVIVPKPELLLLGTGKTAMMPPPFLRKELADMGIQIDAMDTWNACSTYNLLAEEGRRVAAALLPPWPQPWLKQ